MKSMATRKTVSLMALRNFLVIFVPFQKINVLVYFSRKESKKNGLDPTDLTVGRSRMIFFSIATLSLSADWKR
jgi:hypothetical protein